MKKIPKRNEFLKRLKGSENNGKKESISNRERKQY